jgi:hypothetical protein
MDKGIMITGKENIAVARMISLKGALKLETLGMRMSRGRSVYSIVKAEFGLKGSKQKVYDQFVELVEKAKAERKS